MCTNSLVVISMGNYKAHSAHAGSISKKKNLPKGNFALKKNHVEKEAAAFPHIF